MVGIIDVGGGMRDIYGAGVFDYCMDKGIEFKYGIGVSAGSANITSYAAGQRGRNVRFYTIYSKRNEYMGWGQLLRKGNFLNLDYIYGELAKKGGEDPLDYEAIMRSGMEFYVVCTDARTGKAVYYRKEHMSQDDYGIIKASSCLPVINRPYRVGARKLYDGGLSDPIPFEKAFSDGCDKVIVILTRPKDYIRDTKNDRRMSLFIKHRYPRAARDLAKRGEVYNEQLERCRKLEEEGKVLILAPESIGGMKTLTTDTDILMNLYEKGYSDAEKIPAFICSP